MEVTGRGPRPGLAELIRSPGAVVAAAMVAALVGVMVFVVLGFRSMRLDDIRAELGEMLRQREVFLKAADEDRVRWAEVLEHLRKIDARTSK